MNIFDSFLKNRKYALYKYYNLKFSPIYTLLFKTIDFFPVRHPVKKSNNNISCTPFFIIGSGRNGSTLLASMLNQHSKLGIPPENWFLHKIIIKYKLYNYLSWRQLIQIIIKTLRESEPPRGWNIHYYDLHNTLIKLPKSDRSLFKIIDEIYIHNFKLSEIHPTQWGEKSPLYTIYLKYIFSVYQDSKYIFLIRDGRDVISSMVKTNNKSIQFAIQKWNFSIQQYLWLNRRVSVNQILMIKYEDLVFNTKGAMKNILNFIGMKFEKNVLNHTDSIEYLGVEKLIHHQNLKNPISAKSVGKWKKRLTKQERKKILPAIEKNLRRFDYL